LAPGIMLTAASGLAPNIADLIRIWASAHPCRGVDKTASLVLVGLLITRLSSNGL
jgi:hypothetical protein